jgi:hypothetical protein
MVEKHPKTRNMFGVNIKSSNGQSQMLSSDRVEAKSCQSMAAHLLSFLREDEETEKNLRVSKVIVTDERRKG